MKVILINGSPNAKEYTYTALSEVAAMLQAGNIETEIIHVGNGHSRLHRLPQVQADWQMCL